MKTVDVLEIYLSPQTELFEMSSAFICSTSPIVDDDSNW